MPKEPSERVQLNNELDCQGCGAILTFQPGTHHLSCEYCGAENEIFDPEASVVNIEETSLESYFEEGLKQEEKMEVINIRCDSCGGSFTLDPNISSDLCPFCDSPIVINGETTASVYQPKYVLPFDIEKKIALRSYQRWLKSLWFAPGDLKDYARNDRLNGLYIPFWTYDCNTTTSYSGARGDDYSTQQPVRVIENGQNVTRMRSVTKTRWHDVSGHVENTFDDILVVASRSIPKGKMARINAWDLDKLVPYSDKYLSGFRTETYTVKIEDGYQEAKAKMDRHISNAVRNDIGGNRQRIYQLNTQYSGATFKQILIPVWLSAYKYKGKVYQFVVNGRTGAVSGDRPYSTGKIVLVVLAGVLIILLIAIFGG